MLTATQASSVLNSFPIILLILTVCLIFVVPNARGFQMKFKQVKAGFMKRFEGCWRVEALLVDEKLCHPFKPNTLADYVA